MTRYIPESEQHPAQLEPRQLHGELSHATGYDTNRDTDYRFGQCRRQKVCTADNDNIEKHRRKRRSREGPQRIQNAHCQGGQADENQVWKHDLCEQCRHLQFRGSVVKTTLANSHASRFDLRVWYSVKTGIKAEDIDPSANNSRNKFGMR